LRWLFFYILNGDNKMVIPDWLGYLLIGLALLGLYWLITFLIAVFYYEEPR
jgi:hypothetical protein